MLTSLAVAQWILGFILVLSSFGVIVARKPIYSSLFFLLTLLTLATFYLLLSAEFIAVMQVLVYAGAILVIFMFVIVLFQDAHQQLAQFKPKSKPFLIYSAATLFLLALILFGKQLIHMGGGEKNLPNGYGTVQSLGQALYLDFFFPFEAIILLFLVALIGTLYIAKRET